MTPLARRIAERIARDGPLRLDAWMELCLSDPEHGYYITREPFGAEGDFVTAPEVSQMFGEMVGGWLAQVWADQSPPAPPVLVELGPGRGTLMRDALRVIDRVPDLRRALSLWLVETSPRLRAIQATTLEGARARWADRLTDCPPGPLLLVANEFFDALPIRQFQRADVAWRERRVTLRDGRLAFDWGPLRADADLNSTFPQAPDGAIVEVCALAATIAREIAARISAHGGAALVIDYGDVDGVGDTLQALQGGAPVDPLAADPGTADLTAHLRFAALADAAEGLRASGPEPQGAFLERLGITDRARTLARGRTGAPLEAIVAQHRRLTHPGEMGKHFRVLALTPQSAPPPPGFAP